MRSRLARVYRRGNVLAGAALGSQQVPAALHVDVQGCVHVDARERIQVS